MGGNFHDPAQWASQCGFRLTKAHKATFAEVPFSAELLKLCKDTHILVPILKLSIMQLHGKFNGLFYQKDDPWYRTEAFANKQAEVGWILLRREVVPGSTSRSWTDQQALVPEGEQVPSATELVQAVICHAVLTEERLLPSLYARTSSVDSGGSRVNVGRFDADGLSVGYWRGNASSFVGLAGARK